MPSFLSLMSHRTGYPSLAATLASVSSVACGESYLARICLILSWLLSSICPNCLRLLPLCLSRIRSSMQAGETLLIAPACSTISLWFYELVSRDATCPITRQVAHGEGLQHQPCLTLPWQNPAFRTKQFSTTCLLNSRLKLLWFLMAGSSLYFIGNLDPTKPSKRSLPAYGLWKMLCGLASSDSAVLLYQHDSRQLYRNCWLQCREHRIMRDYGGHLAHMDLKRVVLK